PAVVVADARGSVACRRQNASRARRDLATLGRILADAVCGHADRRRFLSGYRRSAVQDSASASPPRLRPGRLTAGFSGLQGDSPMSASPPVAAAAPTTAAASPSADSFWTRLFRGAVRLRQKADWSRFAGPDWPERIMDVTVTD